MNDRVMLWSAFGAVSVAVGVWDRVPSRFAGALGDPATATLLAAFVSLGGAVIAGAIAAALVWVIRSAFLPDGAFDGDSLFDAVSAELAHDDDRLVAEAERIAKDHARRPRDDT